jgi:cytochrome c553
MPIPDSLKGMLIAVSAVHLLAAADVSATRKAPAQANAAFQKAVSPLLSNTCQACHNEQLSSGGLDLTPYLAPASLTQSREGWETILQKLRAGEMPPNGVPRPPRTEIDALIGYVSAEFDKADRAVKPDPGRVTARRLNRSEYSNTVRDLLGVNFRAENDFPTDDSSYGFDTIGSVLTVSPVLMEKYVSAAERIASAAVGADPLPKPFTLEARGSNRTLRRVDGTVSETTQRFAFDADYSIKLRFAGVRPPDSKPMTVGLSLDGKLIQSLPLENKPAGDSEPEQEVEARLFVSAGDHVLRAGFIDDEYGRNLSRPDGADLTKNKVLQTIAITGPYATQVERPSRKKILICDPNSGAACSEKIVGALARRAYRRPVTSSEVAGLMKFVRLARAQGQSAEQSIQLAIEAMLVSPNFLFRIERDPAAGGIHRISGFELASRLSYFLWSSMPDDELLNAAESGKLSAPGALNAQVKRLLADAKSAALAENFAGQWLELRNLGIVPPDFLKFRDWTPELRDDMKTETRLFFEYILRENRPITDFLDAKYTFLNQSLAKHYGIEGVTGQEFRKVDLSSDQRGGLLGQGSVLTVSSYPTRTSVVLRGKYILENILGTPPPPPPPDVPQLDNAAVGTSASLRQQMEKHRSSALCASCHSKMDVLGFGLENYDAIGAWRTMDGKFPVDSSGTLPNGKTFSSPAQMRALLTAELPSFTRCITEKLMTYSLGRGLEPFDRRTVTEIGRELAADNYRFQALIYGIVDSVSFQMRHGEAVPAQSAATPKEMNR